MTAPNSFQIVRFIVFQPNAQPSQGTIDGIEYVRLRGDVPTITATLRLSSRKLQVHPPSKEGVNITELRLPFSREATFEFCSPDITEWLGRRLWDDPSVETTARGVAWLKTEIESSFTLS